METLIEYAALLIGGAVFGLVVLTSVRGWPDRSNRPRAERFIPGNYYPHPHPGEGADDGGHHS